MNAKTNKIGDTHYATLQVLGVKGGFIGTGKTSSLAILDAFTKYNWYRLTENNQLLNN